MLANAQHVMPDELKFAGDKAFFSSALDGADLIVHGRHSHEEQPNSPLRKRVIVTRSIAALAPDFTHPRASLWNPDGASFEAACDFAGVTSGTAAIIGGAAAVGGFMGSSDTFWVSRTPRVSTPHV